MRCKLCSDAIAIEAPGRSRRRSRSSSGRGSEMQPFVARPVSSCRKIPLPRPGTAGDDVVLHDRELAVGDGRAPERFAPAAERRRGAAGDVPEAVVGGRARVLVPPVAAAQPAVAERDARDRGRGRRPSGRARTCRSASCRRPRGAVRESPPAADAGAPRPEDAPAALADASASPSSSAAVGATTLIRCGQASTSASASVSIAAARVRCLPHGRPAAVPRDDRPGDGRRARARRGTRGARSAPRSCARFASPTSASTAARTPVRSSSTGPSRATSVDVFRRLYAARFPIRRLEPIARFGGSDDRSMAADNTSAFNCRYAVAPAPRRWSVHAYGEAIDVEHRREPVSRGRPGAAACGPRVHGPDARYRRGMAVAGGVLVRAFASVGWLWGGRWTGSPDWQHFSKTGG